MKTLATILRAIPNVNDFWYFRLPKKCPLWIKFCRGFADVRAERGLGCGSAFLPLSQLPRSPRQIEVRCPQFLHHFIALHRPSDDVLAVQLLLGEIDHADL